MNKEGILYIFDESSGKDLSLVFKKRSYPGKIFFCGLTTNETIKKEIISRCRSANKNLEYEEINFPFFFDKNAFLVKDPYIKFISFFADSKIIANQNIKEYFKFPHKKFSAWWFSLIAEKSPLKSNSFSRLAAFFSILDIQKKYDCARVCFDMSDFELSVMLSKHFRGKGVQTSNLRPCSIKSKLKLLSAGWHFIYGLRQLFVFMKNSIIVRATIKGRSQRKNNLKKMNFLLVTYFPSVDQNKIDQNIFVDKYYQPLQSALEKKYKNNIAWLAMYHSFKNYDFKESIKLGRKINDWGNVLFFCEEWFSLWDCFMSLWAYFCISLKFYLKKTVISRNFLYPGTDIELWPIFKNDWLNSFSGAYLMQGIICYRIFKSSFRFLKKDCAIIYMSEMQAWEKALNIAADESGHKKTIAIQHTLLPMLLLNYFNDRNDLLANNTQLGMPKPGYLGCTGRIPEHLFHEMGWGKDKTFIAGAMRFRHIQAGMNQKISWQTRKKLVIVALPYMPTEYRELLSYVHEAFKDQTDFKVIVTAHPTCSVRAIIASLGLDFDENIFQTSDNQRSSDILPVARAMVVTESSCALEAIAYQCPVIIPKLAKTVDMSPLTKLSDLGTCVFSPLELREAVIKIMESDTNPVPYDESRGFIKNYFELFDNDSDFLNRIESVVNHN